MTPNCVHQSGARRIRKLGSKINPLRFAQVVLERWRQRRVIGAQCNDRPTFGGRSLDLLADMRGCGGVGRKHKNEDLGLVDRPYNRFCEQGSGYYIPRGDPAPQSTELQGFDERIRDGSVLRRIAEEDGGRPPAGAVVAAALRHISCLPTCPGWSPMSLRLATLGPENAFFSRI